MAGLYVRLDGEFVYHEILAEGFNPATGFFPVDGDVPVWDSLLGQYVPSSGITAGGTGLAAGSAGFLNVTTVTAPYNAVVGDMVLVNAMSVPIRVKLPSLPLEGAQICVRKIDSSPNAVTVVGNNNETMDNDTITTLSGQYYGCTFVFSGVSWYISSITR